MKYLSKKKRAEFREFRDAADSHISLIVDNPVEINENMKIIRAWKPGPFTAGDGTTPADVRMYDGIPYKCVQSHDSTGNEAWNPADTPALWMQYHGTSPETARAWIAPTGAHDMYKAGEFMIWTDGAVYRCKSDTVYSPADYAQAWDKVE